MDPRVALEPRVRVINVTSALATLNRNTETSRSERSLEAFSGVAQDLKIIALIRIPNSPKP